MKLTLTFLSAFLFGAGLELSQMTNPQKVQGFLNIFRNWDPSLIFVMIGAISLNGLVYFIGIRKKTKPLFSEKFYTPALKKLTWELTVGSTLFGIGWGLSGFCPGPAISGIFRLQKENFIVLFSMIVGMGLYSYCYTPLKEKVFKN